MAATTTTRVHKATVNAQLVTLALHILNNECPDDNKNYYCLCEDYDETACKRCWEARIFDIIGNP